MPQVSNVAASCRGALAASSAVLDASRCALQGELGASLAQFDEVMEGTGELQVEVVDEVRRAGMVGWCGGLVGWRVAFLQDMWANTHMQCSAHLQPPALVLHLHTPE